MKTRLNNYLDKFCNIIEKIGKQNVILVLFIFVVILATTLYQTFSLYTINDGLNIIAGVKTYNFILTNNEENTVTIAANSSKNLLITVSNPHELDLKYGIYYTSSNDLADVSIGYLTTSKNLPNGMIEANNERIITTKVTNNSEEPIMITFGTKYGFEKAGNLILDSEQIWLGKYYLPLNNLEDSEGSYVRFVGNNGCSKESCSGQNANYVNDNDMGYCQSSSYKYIVNGWRIAYVKNGFVYLVAAGAPECLSTDSTGAVSSEMASDYETTDGVPLHLANLNAASLKYCNKAFVINNDCASATRSINGEDFYQITGNELTSSPSSCFDVSSKECGFNNDLIANGGYYWFAKAYDVDNPDYQYNYFNTAFKSDSMKISNNYTKYNDGLRPVIQLDSDVVIVDGRGTYKEPYILENFNTIRDLSGNMNNGVVNGATWDKNEGILTTDGVDDYVDMGMVNYDFGSDITLGIRVKFNDLQSGSLQEFFGNWQSGGGGFYIGESSVLQFSMYIDTKFYTYKSSISLEEDTWYTLIGTYDGTNIKFYINGELAPLDGTSSTTVTGTIKPGDAPFYIGGSPPSTGTEVLNLSNLTVSDAIIFDRALTTEEIANNYADEILVKDKTDLLLHYNFLWSK